MLYSVQIPHIGFILSAVQPKIISKVKSISKLPTFPSLNSFSIFLMDSDEIVAPEPPQEEEDLNAK